MLSSRCSETPSAPVSTTASGHAGCLRAGLGGARDDQQVAGRVRIRDEQLGAVQRQPATSGRGRGQVDRIRAEGTVVLDQGRHDDGVARPDLAEQFARERCPGGVQRTARDHGRVEVRTRYQRPSDLGVDHRQVERAAAGTAVLVREAEAEPVELGHLLPQLGREAGSRRPRARARPRSGSGLRRTRGRPGPVRSDRHSG